MPNPPRYDSLPFTVLLLVPEDCAETYGVDRYLAKVYAEDESWAVIEAQTEAEEYHDNDDPDSFTCLLVIAGHHADLTPTAEE